MTDGSSQGLFVIVAVVIFGIFIAISYLIFSETLKPSLATIFTDSLSEAYLQQQEIDNIKSFKTVGAHTFVKLNSKDSTNTDVYIQLVKNQDGTFSISGSSISEDSTISYGLDIKRKDLILPNKVDGIRVTKIKDSAFYHAVFSGNLLLPRYLEVIEKNSFFESKFSGKLSLPKTIKEIGDNSIPYSIFTGNLILPEGIEYIGNNALLSSNFTGDLILPESLNTLGIMSLRDSPFGGIFIQKNKNTVIERDALLNGIFKNKEGTL